ncbi:YitT family protein [Asaia astilbis]|uniref:YitT family protein n=1 Tax=Asaia astilbis TaxID=610244 RepID=UPI000472ECCA|nr:YitT family protein [Asaia astilbis]
MTSLAETPYEPGLRHSTAEDIYAFLIGCSLIVMGLICLHKAGLVTGGMAGIALLISYFVPMAPGLLFTLINIPFLAFALRAMSPVFAIKTMIASFGITFFASLMPHVITVSQIDPIFSAIFAGTIIGLGILCLARHQAGVGGTGIMALWLQKTRGINAGRVQISIDIVILAISAYFLPAYKIALSLLSAVAMSGILIVYHRPGRYIGH